MFSRASYSLATIILNAYATSTFLLFALCVVDSKNFIRLNAMDGLSEWSGLGNGVKNVWVENNSIILVLNTL